MAKKNPSVAEQIIEGLEDFAEALESGEDVAERFTCHRIALDIEPTAYDAELVKETRRRLQVSQAIFAQFLGVSRNTVRAWEQGINEPRGIACRFMDEIRGNPPYWRRRVEEHAKRKRETTSSRRTRSSRNARP